MIKVVSGGLNFCRKMEYYELHRLTSKKVVAFAALTLLTSTLILSIATTAQATSYTVPFNANSIWNRPIGASPALNPKSAQMIQLLSSTVGTSVNIDGINGAWSVPVYYAPAGTPLQQVCDTNDYRPCEMVPVPSGMFPSPDSDAKTVIVDQSTNHAWSFYGMVKGDGSNGDWSSLNGAFGWGYTSTQGDGIHNYGGGMWGGRVAGWNYYAGLIHPEEIQAGVINHAVAFFIPRQVATLGSYVWPAAGTDGSSTNTNAIPVGSHIQLDPSINVSTLPLTAGGKMIARALQVYGGWIADTGVAAAVDAREFVTSDGSGVNAAPWQGLLTYRDLYGIPVSSLRVLQVNQGDYYVEGTSPTPTNTPTNTPIKTNTPTNTPTKTPTKTNTPVNTPTKTPTKTNTPIYTPTRTPTKTNTPINTPSPTPTMQISAPTVYDSMDSGAQDWKIIGGTWALKSTAAYLGTGLGWIATGGITGNTLRWYRQIDLRSVPNAYLWVQSILSTGNTGFVQVSLDGSTWSYLGTTISPSTSWYVPSINLSAYVGKIIQLRFFWMPKLATDVWKLDDVTVGVLQTVQTSMVQADVRQANSLQSNAVVQPTSTPAPAVFNGAASTLAQTIPAGYTAVESDAATVSQQSAWQLTTQPSGASGNSYLINSDPAATLSLPFQGDHIGIAFVAGPSFGQFSIEIDGTARQVVNTNASDYQFGQVIVNGLSAGAHTVRVVPSGGVVGIDAFLVPTNAAQPTATTLPPTQAATTAPTTVDISQLPTALPFPTLNVPVDIPSATVMVPTEVATLAVSAPTGVPPTTDSSQLPTALPFPTLDIPVDVTPLASTVPPTQALPSSTSALPVSTPTVYDSMDDGAHDWVAAGKWTLTASAAYNGSGLGWIANGGAKNLLRWNRMIDLRSVPNAHLWVQSILASADAPLVQVSNDGNTWTSIGTIPASSDWQVASVDLTPYVGQVIQLQFVWTTQNSSDSWKFDDVTVGVLQASAPSPTQAAPTASPQQTTAVPTATAAAATSTPVPPSATAAPTSTDTPTQVPTTVPTTAPTLVPPTAAAASTETASS